MKTSKGRWGLGLVALVLAGALALQFAPRRSLALPVGSGRDRALLAETLPTSLPGGWVSHDLPLGQNEVVRNQTEALLRFDDYVYREYSRAGRSFTVYIAYWKPGKMPTRLVALHTPDRCWVENGWHCEASRNAARIDGTPRMPPGEWRIFTTPDRATRVYTAFWLLVSGRAYHFGDGLNTIPNPIRWWRNVVDEAAGDKAEHVFYRITSERPFEELADDPAWLAVSGSLASLGLRETATPSRDR